MRNWYRGGLFAITAVALAAVTSLLMTRAAAQAPAFNVPRTADGKPNLNGTSETTRPSKTPMPKPPSVTDLPASGPGGTRIEPNRGKLRRGREDGP